MACAFKGKEPEILTAKDRNILRDLARRVKEAAADPRMAERRRHWMMHNDLEACPPIVWLSPEGAWREILPESLLQCMDPEARLMEWDLRARLHRYGHFEDASVIEARWEVPKAIHVSGWGIEAEWTDSPDAFGARRFKPVIHSPGDLQALRMPVVSHDEAETERRLSIAQEALGDIFEVVLTGRAQIGFHMMNTYTSWRGLEETMIDMHEQPAMLHDAMAFLTEGHEGILRQMVEQELLSLNNNDTYHSSGGKGWTAKLPAAGYDGVRVRPRDMWASSESQEMAQVSPEMHREFALEYERKLLAPFARNGYGCCEDLTRKLEDVLTLPNIWRISISPWADVQACAAKLRGKYIFSWKPNPAHLVGRFDEQAIKAYLMRTVGACKENGCHLEIILKDTHTCEDHAERFDRWAKLAQEAIAETWQGRDS
jgi:hypothetical protein